VIWVEILFNLGRLLQAGTMLVLEWTLYAAGMAAQQTVHLAIKYLLWQGRRNARRGQW